MNPLMWIPNCFKGMLEVLKEAEKAAGGGWKGRFVFWCGMFMFAVLFVVFVLWVSKPAYDNFAEFVGYFNISIRHVDVAIPSSLFPNLLLAVLLAIIEFIFLAGIAFVIAAFLATFTGLVFSPFTTRRIDNIFTELLPIVTRNHAINPTDESKKVLDETNNMFERWNKSRFNRFIRRTTTKKDREKFDSRKL